MLAASGQFTVGAEKGFLVVLVEVVHEVHQAGDDLFTNALHQIDPFTGDLHHDLASVIGGVQALHVAQFLQAVHQARSSCSGVAHLLGDVRHRQKILIGQIAEQEELRKGHVALI